MPVIKIKRGAGAPSSLNEGELALNTSNNQLYVGTSGSPRKIVGTLASQESNNVSLTGGTVSNTTNTATNTNLNNLALTGSETLWYNEGADCRSTISNWNDQQVYNMTDCAGLGNCHIHGWGGSARSYTLNLSSLPAHTEVMYECYIHMIDSWDGEDVQIFTTDNAGSEVRRAYWTKTLSVPRVDGLSLAGGTTTQGHWGKYYSYAPWNGEGGDTYNSNYGYVKVNTGWYSHSSSTFSARHYTGLNQAAGDEAFYISHVRLWLRGTSQSVNTISTSTSLADNSNTLPTQNAVNNYANQYVGALKNMYSYTGNSTYTKSGSDVRLLRVICVGGGGGGRGYHESGGAGGFTERWIDATNISSVSITVGGGSGGGYYFGFSGQGGTSSFGGYCSANGGYGANQNRSHAGGHGGTGYGGFVNLHGGGGGGHAPGYNNQQGGMSGEGGASFFGGGGCGRHGGNSHSNVAAPGGGGPGGAGNHNGSNGYTGMVVVYEYK